MSHPCPPAEFDGLCLTLAAGQDVSAARFAEAGRRLRQSHTGLLFLDAFYGQVHDLQKRFPAGRLARELLTPLLTYMQRLEAA